MPESALASRGLSSKVLPEKIPVNPRLAVTAAVAAGFLTAFYAFFQQLRYRDTGYFEVTRENLSVVFLGSVMTAIGAVTIFGRYRTRTAVLSAVAAALLALGALAILSIGVLFIALGAAVLVAMLLTTGDLDSSTIRGSITSGFGLGLGLVLVLVSFGQSPIVNCSQDGVTTSAAGNRGALSGSGSSSNDGSRVSGTVTIGNETIVFTCERGKLVELVRQ